MHLRLSPQHWTTRSYSHVPLQIFFFRIPANNNSPTATLGSWGFSILKSSLKKDHSYKVITFLTSNSSQKQLFIKYGYTPTKEELFNDKKLTTKYPILNSLKKALKKTKPRPENPLYAQISDVLQRQLSSVLTGETSIEDSMKKAQRNTEQVLSSGGNIWWI